MRRRCTALGDRPAASLSRVEYDRVRMNEAKELRMRARTLDAEVASLRKELVGDSILTFEDPEPWPARGERGRAAE